MSIRTITRTITRITTGHDRQVTATLTLAQWFSPAFPTGAFACSHGLEQLVADGTIRSAQDVQDWLGAVLHHGAGWQDSVLMALVLRGQDPARIDAMARALQPCAERARESLDQGAAFARTMAAMTGDARPPRALAVAQAEAARALDLPPAQVIAAALLSFATNLVTVAVRAVPLGQTDGQRVLARLLPGIDALALRAAEAGEDDLATFLPGADLAAFRHETLQPRIYRT